MLTGHNIVYFAPETWDGLWRNRQQLMSVFARQNRVLFVEPRLHLRPTLTGFRRRSLGPSDLFSPSVRQISNNLFVFRYPIWAPISGRFPSKQLTRTVRRIFIRNALRKLKMSQSIVWFSRPDMVDLVDEIPSAHLLVYHVVDEYAAYSDHTPVTCRRTEEQEKEMMGRVDAVVVVSKKLYEAKRPFNANTYLVPNGVNYQAYTAALVDSHLPDDLRVIKPPRLGYSGLIGDRLNLTVLKELVQENPEVSLVFLGELSVSRQMETWQALLARPNVHYLGAVDITQVPHYLKGLDVGLIPYGQSREAENVSPLKLYDYLAAGLPVVSIDFPAAREFSTYIHLTDDSPKNFSHTVRVALTDTTPERRQARRNIAAQHTWEARVEQLSDIIQAQLPAKS
jgi:glycosyltransferase involved in cell wall biosynthesis